MLIPLTEEVAQKLTFQEYGPGRQIEGVHLQPLKKHCSLDGWFMEFMLMNRGEAERIPVAFDVRQISFSQAAPHRINAFHLHPKVVQDELWCVVQGTMKVWLVDVRRDSPTVGVKCAYTLTGEAPALLHIPSGVAHGYRAGAAGALLVYAMNSQFDISDPNEGRLPFDHFGADLWEDDKG